MVVKSMVTRDRNGVHEIMNVDALIERLKKLRALNREPYQIGLTQYTWRSFSIDKIKRR